VAITISDTVEIDAPPETVFDWFLELDQHYRQWHPDHRNCYWLKGGRLQPGSVLYAEEILHGQLHKLRYEMTEIEHGRFVRFRLLGAIGLLVPRGEFRIEATPSGSRFTATLYPRFARLLRLIIPQRVQALVVHQQQEGRNLQSLFSDSPGSGEQPVLH